MVSNWSATLYKITGYGHCHFITSNHMLLVQEFIIIIIIIKRRSGINPLPPTVIDRD